MKETFIVAINAISGGGKTTITKELQKRLPDAKALYFDDRDYDSNSGIDDICEWVEEGADVNKFNLELLEDDIDSLIENKPKYILLDYPFGRRHKLIGKYVDFSIFIDTSLDVALARRIIRDYDKITVSNIFSDMEQYLSQGRSAYLYGLDKVRNDADYIIDGDKSIDYIVTKILEKLAAIN